MPNLSTAKSGSARLLTAEARYGRRPRVGLLRSHRPQGEGRDTGPRAAAQATDPTKLMCPALIP